MYIRRAKLYNYLYCILLRLRRSPHKFIFFGRIIWGQHESRGISIWCQTWYNVIEFYSNFDIVINIYEIWTPISFFSFKKKSATTVKYYEQTTRRGGDFNARPNCIKNSAIYLYCIYLHVVPHVWAELAIATRQSSVKVSQARIRPPNFDFLAFSKQLWIEGQWIGFIWGQVESYSGARRCYCQTDRIPPAGKSS